jgi:hypothetical protein
LFAAAQIPDLSAITTDLSGKNRINNGVDIGAYESGIGITSVKQDVLCYNDITGSITTTIVGGTPPYTYSWNTTPVQTTQNITSLPAGTYTLTVNDSGSLSATHSVTINQPTALAATAGTQINVLCHGNTTGSATVNVTGGTGAYTYSWDTTPVQTTAAASNLSAGTYTVTVTDANLCTTTQGFTITEPSVLTATAGTQVDVLCHGNSTGSATVNVTGGTGAYTYSWDTTPVQTTATASNLSAGTYTVTVTDANLCTTTQGFTITEPLSALAATAGTQVNVLCNGNATGLATVNVTGGTGAYTYSWDTTPVQTTATASNLSAGTYTVTVTDANLCTTTQGFTITEPTVLTATAGAQVNVLCHGNATGQATVNVTGGTAIYTYSWDTTPVQITPTITGLTAGTYTVTVTDANLCTATQSFTITEPSVLTASAGTQVNVLCFGNATGSATVNVTGGAGAYTYSWDTTPVQTTATASILSAGTYTVTVTDANSCTATQSFIITEPAAAMTLTPNTTQTDVLCNGQATGTATVAVTGGTGAYTYLWSNGGTTNTITGLTAGTYTVDVTDANGCILSNSFTITQPSALTATAGTQVDVLCFGNATGTATVNVTGGTGAYSYSWNTTPVQTTATATGLTAGTHTVTVTDANLCTTTQAFTITEPSLLVATASPQNNVLCYGNATGEATVNVTGGAGTYTYSWDTTPVQTTATATGLAAGTHTVTVTDANLCTTTQSFTITQPTAALAATAGNQVNVLCFGNATGAATVNVTGGTGAYSYSWDTTPVQTAATAAGLAAGTYTVTVTDANLCTTTQAFTITEPLQPLALTPNTTQTDVLCNGQATGSATVAVNGGTAPYSYLWNNGQTTNTITGLTAGTYTVTVTDANGCIVSNSFTITQPSALVAMAGPQNNVLCFGNATGTATVNVTGGTGAYVYNWSPSGGTAATATGLAEGTYIVTVTDANLCQTTQSFTITQPLQPLSTTPNTTQTNVSCFAGSNGTATMALNGGTAPYTYLWNNGQTTAIATGLAAGIYSVIATDANGCTLSQSFTITEPTALVATAGPQTNITCFGAANGSATVNATGGTGAYTYSWNTTPVQTTATATGLAPGNYTVTVTDANLCTATQAFTITQPQLLTAAVNNFANILCYGAATGSAGVSASGGTAPYTYLWNTGQTTDTATGLTAGSYTVFVTDAHGCQANASITLTQPASPLVATAGPQTNLICNGNTNGSATVNVTGGTGAYSYSWNTTPVQTTATATGLAAGTYTVTVYDANQCQTTRSFTITQPAVVGGYFTVIHSDCHATGSATVHAVGGVGPYTYLWSNSNTTPNLQNALPGTYTVTITDTNGCSNVLSTTINGTAPIVVISAPQSVTLNGGESVSFTVEAQNATFYQWQVSTNGGASFTNLNAGGSLPTYYGVATPTLSITNAYSFIDGYLFRVILMQQSGCYIVSEAATLNVGPVVVGIDDIKHLGMDIYPNPASTDVFVKIPDFASHQNIKLMMYDLNGRLVKNESQITSENYSMDVSGLESGIYIITIISDTARTDKKLIVTKKP